MEKGIITKMIVPIKIHNFSPDEFLEKIEVFLPENEDGNSGNRNLEFSGKYE